MDVTKPTNPKDMVGTNKAPMSCVPISVIAEMAVAMYEGARKYGRANYRDAGVLGSVYYDACLRHLMAWYEGEDTDPDSGLSHITKAIACLVVLRDAMRRDMWVDDRPPRCADGWIAELNAAVAALNDRYPEPAAPHTELTFK